MRRIDLKNGIVTAFFAGEPPAFPLDQPFGLAVDPAGNVYVGSRGQLVKLDPEGRVLRRWGTVYGYSEDGTPLDAMLVGYPAGIAIEADGNLLFSDLLVGNLRRMNFATGKLETVAGIAPRAFGGPGRAIGAVLIGPLGDIGFFPSEEEGARASSFCTKDAAARRDVEEPPLKRWVSPGMGAPSTRSRVSVADCAHPDKLQKKEALAPSSASSAACPVE